MASFAANSSRCAHRHAWPKSYEPCHVAPFVKGSPELETTAKRRASASCPRLIGGSGAECRDGLDDDVCFSEALAAPDELRSFLQAIDAPG